MAGLHSSAMLANIPCISLASCSSLRYSGQWMVDKLLWTFGSDKFLGQKCVATLEYHCRSEPLLQRECCFLASDSQPTTSGNTACLLQMIKTAGNQQAEQTSSTCALISWQCQLNHYWCKHVSLDTSCRILLITPVEKECPNMCDNGQLKTFSKI